MSKGSNAMSRESSVMSKGSNVMFRGLSVISKGSNVTGLDDIVCPGG